MKINFSKLKDRLSNTKMENNAFLFFVILYSAGIIFLLKKFDFSYDEPYSLYTSANKLSEVIRLSYEFEFQPPAYFIILSIWRKIDEGIFFARLLSLIFTFLSAFFLYKVIRLLFDKIHTKWLIVLFLLNPFTVYYSAEIRLYSMLSLLTILAVYLFYLIYFNNRYELKFHFVLIATLGVYTQYFFVFLIISFGIVLLVAKEWRSLFSYLLLSSLIALLFIPNLWFLKDQIGVTPNTLMKYTFPDRLKSIIMSSSEFFVIKQSFLGGRIARWILRLAFVSVYMTALFKLFVSDITEIWKDFRNLGFIFLQTVSLLALFILAFTFSNIPFATRYITVLFAFHIILMAVFGIFREKVRNVVYFFTASLFLFAVVMTYKPPYIKSFDFKSVAGYVQRVQIENEPVLFLNNDLFLGLKHIYENDKSFISLPEYQFNYNVYNNLVKDTTELDRLIKNVKSESPSFIIVTGTDLGYLRNKDLTNEMTDSYLNNNYTILLDTTFEGNLEVDFIRLRRIIKKSVND